MVDRSPLSALDILEEIEERAGVDKRVDYRHSGYVYIFIVKMCRQKEAGKSRAIIEISSFIYSYIPTR